MNRPRRPDPGPRGGYIALLAMSLTVGLAIFAGAITTGTVSYIRTTGEEARTLRERITMESAAATLLGTAVTGEAIASQSEWVQGERRYRLSVSPVSGKIDLDRDAEAVVRGAADAAGLELPPGARRAAAGLADLGRRAGLDASGEDCLRSIFTYGRGGQPRATRPVPPTLMVQPGDQVDVRVSGMEEPTDVLWMRVRFTQEGWALHDYRRLRGVTACAA